MWSVSVEGRIIATAIKRRERTLLVWRVARRGYRPFIWPVRMLTNKWMYRLETIRRPDRQWRSSSFQESKKVRVSRDLDLDLEHTLDARLPGDHRVQVWSRSGHLPARSDLRKSLQTDRRRTPRHCISSFLEWAKNVNTDWKKEQTTRRLHWLINS